ncbi:JAB domain-containing protein [uncultured Eubacterium sp.]|uniref:JAB domain-containing protein n=1 Tax=uncultured Eubacterium sp. TaxID=165185 RepID=UPI0026267AEE|nr:JAB domain-containing protein [uncultured Eubacterium sp.]
MGDADLKQRREKLKTYYKTNGSENMTDKELLEAVLTISLCKNDGKEVADNLMSEYGNIKNMFFLSPNQLLKTDKVDENTAVYLSLMRYIKAKSELDKNENIKTFTDTDRIIEFAKNMLFAQAEERVILVTLDEDKRLINADYISQGNANSASVMPSDVSRRIIDENPRYAFVAHNHLTDTCVASFSDINFTVNLSNWLGQFGIVLIDHIIVSKNTAVSMAEDEEYSFIFN